jgi:hypothetical protein
VKKILVLIAIVLSSRQLPADVVLKGHLIIPYAGYDNYTFSNCYIYVEELERHYEIAEDGSFEITIEAAGQYVISPICPGFVATPIHIDVPYPGELEIPLELQRVEVTVRVVQEIPAYIVNLQKSFDSIGGEPQTLTDNQYHKLLSESLSGVRSPTIDFGALIEFLLEQAEKRKEEENAR